MKNSKLIATHSKAFWLIRYVRINARPCPDNAIKSSLIFIGIHNGTVISLGQNWYSMSSMSFIMAFLRIQDTICNRIGKTTFSCPKTDSH